MELRLALTLTLSPRERENFFQRWRMLTDLRFANAPNGGSLSWGRGSG